MGIAGTQAGAIIGSQVGANTDWSQPNAGGGGGGAPAAGPFDMTTLSLNPESTYDMSSYQTVPSGIWWKPDGSIVYVIGSSPARIHAYAVPTAWDLTSIVAAPTVSGDVLSNTLPGGLWISDDGTYVSWGGRANGWRCYAGTMSTPWDISTLGSVVDYNSGGNDTVWYPVDNHFSADGTIWLVQELPSDYLVNQYSLSTPFDITTATFVGVYDHSAATGSLYSVGLWINGLEVYLQSQTTGLLYKFTWDGADITTMTLDSTQAYTNPTIGSGNLGLWMNSEYVSYVNAADDIYIHSWGPHE